jgi:hypothetical protein
MPNDPPLRPAIREQTQGAPAYAARDRDAYDDHPADRDSMTPLRGSPARNGRPDAQRHLGLVRHRISAASIRLHNRLDVVGKGDMNEPRLGRLRGAWPRLRRGILAVVDWHGRHL